MRAIVLALVALFWISPALAEQKAPDGFGPIKFGMTKEEAWEAIGGEGQWEDDVLVHKEGLPEFLRSFYDVRHHFLDGKAYDVTIQNPDERMPFSGCATHLAEILGIITNKYGVYPVKIDSMFSGHPSPSINYTNIYQFHYYDDSFIMATIFQEAIEERGELQEVACILAIQYAPPQVGFSGGF